MTTFNFKKTVSPTGYFSKLFEIRNTLYLCHLRQYDEKLSTHLALDEAQEGIQDLIDRLVETYFGLYGTMDFNSPESSPTRDILSYTQSSHDFVKSNRSLFTDSSLLQIIDDIQEVLSKLLYKLKFVK